MILLLAAALMAAVRLASAWAAQPIAIDGRAGEWAALTPLEDTRISIGVQNDAQYLYVAIVSSDQGRRQQLLTGGLIVWLDAGGGKKKTFGLRLPGVIGQMAGARGSLPDITYFEVLGPKDEDRRRVERASTRAIQVDRKFEEGAVSIEMQIPLAKNDGTEFAIGARAGQVIGLGLETPKMERPEELAPGGRGGGGMGRGGGRGGGGRGGGGGGGRGGMGGGAARGGARGERPDSLNYWTTVQLISPRQP